MGKEEAEVFTAHIMVLEDPELLGGITGKIDSDSVNAEAALKETTDMYIGMFEAMADDNPYMAERAADIRDVTKRVLSHLLGKELPNPALIKEEVVIVAKDMTPSDTAQLDRQYVKGIHHQRWWTHSARSYHGSYVGNPSYRRFKGCH